MRLTNDIRDTITIKAMKGVPTIDYLAKLEPVIQAVLCKHMPDKVKAAYDDEEARAYLKSAQCAVKDGNRYYWISAKRAGDSWDRRCEFYGVTSNRNIEIQINRDAFKLMKKGTLNFDLAKAVIDTGYVEKHAEQEALRKDVERRLRNTLSSVTTTKRLRDVLEPELHHLIPVEGDKTANLPAMAAPVVDDLRKLGAQLPNVPKAK